MRIMAIDYGDAHTGVAISDLTGLLAAAAIAFAASYICFMRSEIRSR